MDRDIQALQDQIASKSVEPLGLAPLSLDENPFQKLVDKTREDTERISRPEPLGGNGANNMELELVPDKADPNAPIEGARVWGKPYKAEELAKYESGKRLLQVMAKNRKGRMGFAEGFTPGLDQLPFVGDYMSAGFEIAELGGIRDTFEKMNKGEEVSDEALITARLYIAENERKSQAKILGKVGQGARVLPTLAAEMASYGFLYSTIVGAAPATAGLAAKALSKSATKAMTTAVKHESLKAVRELAEQGLASEAKKVTKTAVDEYIKTKLSKDVLKEAVEKSAAKIGYDSPGVAARLGSSDAIADMIQKEGLATVSNAGLARDVGSYYLKRGLFGGARGGNEALDIAADGVAGKTLGGRALDTLGLLTLTPATAAIPFTAIDEVVDASVSALAPGTEYGESRQKLGLEIQGAITQNQNLKDNAYWYALGLKASEYASEQSGQGFKMLGKTFGELADVADHAWARKTGKLIGGDSATDAMSRANIRRWQQEMNQSLKWTGDGDPRKFSARVGDIQTILNSMPAAGDAIGQARKSYFESRLRGTFGWWAAQKMAKHNLNPSALHSYLGKIGQDGWLEEIAEERWNDFVQGFWGLNNGSESMGFKAAIAASWPGKDQLLSEALLFAIPGATVSAMDKTYANFSEGSLTDIGNKMDKVAEHIYTMRGQHVKTSASGKPTVVLEGDQAQEPGEHGEPVYNRGQASDAVADIMYLGSQTKKGAHGFAGRVLDYATRVVQTAATGHVGYLAGRGNTYAGVMAERGLSEDIIDQGKSVWLNARSDMQKDEIFLNGRAWADVQESEKETEIRKRMRLVAEDWVKGASEQQGTYVIPEKTITTARNRVLAIANSKRNPGSAEITADQLPESVVRQAVKDMVANEEVTLESTGFLGQAIPVYSVKVEDEGYDTVPKIAKAAARNAMADSSMTGMLVLERGDSMDAVVPILSAMMNKINLTDDTLRRIADDKMDDESRAAMWGALQSVGITPFDPKNVGADGLPNANHASKRFREMARRIVSLKDLGYLGHRITGSLLDGATEKPISISVKKVAGGFSVDSALDDTTAELARTGKLDVSASPLGSRGVFPTVEALRRALLGKFVDDNGKPVDPKVTLTPAGLTAGNGGFNFSSQHMIAAEDPVQFIAALKGSYMLGLDKHVFSDASIATYLSLAKDAATSDTEFARQMRDAAEAALHGNPFATKARVRGTMMWTLVPGAQNDSLGNIYSMLTHRLSNRDVVEEVFEKMYKRFTEANRVALSNRPPAALDRMVGAAHAALQDIVADKNQSKENRDAAQYAAEQIFTQETDRENVEAFSKLCTDVFCYHADASTTTNDILPLTGVMKLIAPVLREHSGANEFVAFMLSVAQVPVAQATDVVATENFGKLFMPAPTSFPGYGEALAYVNERWVAFNNDLAAAKTHYGKEWEEETLPESRRDLNQWDPVTLVHYFKSGPAKVVFFQDGTHADIRELTGANSRAKSTEEKSNQKTDYSLIPLSELCAKHPTAIRLIGQFLDRYYVPLPDPVEQTRRISKFLGTGDRGLRTVSSAAIGHALALTTDQMLELEARENGDNSEPGLGETTGDTDAMANYGDNAKRIELESHPLVNVLLRVLGSWELGNDNLSRKGFGDMVSFFVKSAVRDEEVLEDSLGLSSASGAARDSLFLEDGPDGLRVTSTPTEKSVVAEHPWSVATLLSACGPANPANAIAWRTEATFKEWCMSPVEYALANASVVADNRALVAAATEPGAKTDRAAAFLQKYEDTLAIKNQQFKSPTTKALITLFGVAGYAKAKELLAQMYSVIPGMGIQLSNEGAAEGATGEGGNPRNATTRLRLQALTSLAFPAFHDTLLTLAKRSLQERPADFRGLSAAGQPLHDFLEVTEGKKDGDPDLRYEVTRANAKKESFEAWKNRLEVTIIEGWLSGNGKGNKTGDLKSVIAIWDAVLGANNQVSTAISTGYNLTGGDGNRATLLGKATIDLILMTMAMHKGYAEASRDERLKSDRFAGDLAAAAAFTTIDAVTAQDRMSSATPAINIGGIAFGQQMPAVPAAPAAIGALIPAIPAAGSNEAMLAAAEALRDARSGKTVAVPPPVAPVAYSATETESWVSKAKDSLNASSRRDAANASSMHLFYRDLFGKSQFASRYYTPKSRSQVSLTRRMSPMDDALVSSDIIASYITGGSKSKDARRRLRRFQLTGELDGIPVIGEVSGIKYREIQYEEGKRPRAGRFVTTIDYSRMDAREYNEALMQAFFNPTLRLGATTLSFRVFAGDKSTTWTTNLPAAVVAEIVRKKAVRDGIEKYQGVTAERLMVAGHVNQEFYDYVSTAVAESAEGGFSIAGYKRQRVKNSEGARPMVGFEDGVGLNVRMSVLLRSPGFWGDNGVPNETMWGKIYEKPASMARLQTSYGKPATKAVTAKFHVIANLKAMNGVQKLLHLKGNTFSNAAEGEEDGLARTVETLKASPVPSDRALGEFLAAAFAGADSPDMYTDGDAAKESWINDKDFQNATVSGADGAKVTLKSLITRDIPLSATDVYPAITVGGIEYTDKTLADVFPGFGGTRVITSGGRTYVAMDLVIPTSGLFQASHLTHDTKLHPSSFPLPAVYDYTAFGDKGIDFLINMSAAQALRSDLCEAAGLMSRSRLDIVAALEGTEAEVFARNVASDAVVLGTDALTSILGPKFAARVRTLSKMEKPTVHAQVDDSSGRYYPAQGATSSDLEHGKIVHMYGAENVAVHEPYRVKVGGGVATKFGLFRLNVKDTKVRRGMFLRPDAATAGIVAQLEALDKVLEPALADKADADRNVQLAEAEGKDEVVLNSLRKRAARADAALQEARGKHAPLMQALQSAQVDQRKTLAAKLDDLHSALARIGKASDPGATGLETAMVAKLRVLDLLTDEFGKDLTSPGTEGGLSVSNVDLDVSFEDLYARFGGMDETAFYVSGETIPGHPDVETHPGRGFAGTKYLAALAGTLFSRDRNPGGSLAAHGFVRLFYAADYEPSAQVKITRGFEIDAETGTVRKVSGEPLKDVMVPGRGNRVVLSPITQQIIGNDNDGDTDFESTFYFDRFGRVPVAGKADRAMTAPLATDLKRRRDEAVRQFMAAEVEGRQNREVNKYGYFGADGQLAWDTPQQRGNYLSLTEDLVEASLSPYTNALMLQQADILDTTGTWTGDGSVVEAEEGWLRGNDAYMPINTDPLASPEKIASPEEIGKKDVRSVEATGYEALAFSGSLRAINSGAALRALRAGKTIPNLSSLDYEWVPLRLHPVAKARLALAGVDTGNVETEHTFFGKMGLSKPRNPQTTEEFVTSQEISQTGALSRGTIVSGIRDTILAKVAMRAELNLARADADGRPAPMLRDALGRAIRYKNGGDGPGFAALSRSASAESLRLALEWTKDLVNLIIDDPKDAKALSMGLYPDYIRLYTVLLCGTEFKSIADIARFHGEFVAWTQTPVAQVFRDEKKRMNLVNPVPVQKTTAPDEKEYKSRERMRNRVVLAAFMGSEYTQNVLTSSHKASELLTSMAPGLADWYGPLATEIRGKLATSNPAASRAVEAKAAYAMGRLAEIAEAEKNTGVAAKDLVANMLASEPTNRDLKAFADAYQVYTDLEDVQAMAFGLGSIARLGFLVYAQNLTTAHDASRMIVSREKLGKWVARTPDQLQAFREAREIPLVIPAGEMGSKAAEVVEAVMDTSKRLSDRIMQSYAGSLDISEQMKWLAYSVLSERGEVNERDNPYDKTNVASLLEQFEEHEFERMQSLVRALVHQQAAFQTLSRVTYDRILAAFPPAVDAGDRIPSVRDFWLGAVNRVMRGVHDSVFSGARAQELLGRNDFLNMLQLASVNDDPNARTDTATANAIQMRIKQSGISPEVLTSIHSAADDFLAYPGSFRVLPTGNGVAFDVSPREVMNLLWLYGVAVYGPELTRGESGSFMALLPPSIQEEKWDTVASLMTHGAGRSLLPGPEVREMMRVGRQRGDMVTVGKFVAGQAGWGFEEAVAGFRKFVDVPANLPAMTDIQVGLRYTQAPQRAARAAVERPKVAGVRTAEELVKAQDVLDVMSYGSNLVNKTGRALANIQADGFTVTTPDGERPSDFNELFRNKLGAIPELAEFFAIEPTSVRANIPVQSAVNHVLEAMVGPVVNSATNAANRTHAKAMEDYRKAYNKAKKAGTELPALPERKPAEIRGSTFVAAVNALGTVFASFNRPRPLGVIRMIQSGEGPFTAFNLDNQGILDRYLAGVGVGLVPNAELYQAFKDRVSSGDKATEVMVQAAYTFYGSRAAFERDSIGVEGFSAEESPMHPTIAMEIEAFVNQAMPTGAGIEVDMSLGSFADLVLQPLTPDQTQDKPKLKSELPRYAPMSFVCLPPEVSTVPSVGIMDAFDEGFRQELAAALPETAEEIKARASSVTGRLAIQDAILNVMEKWAEVYGWENQDEFLQYVDQEGKFDPADSAAFEDERKSRATNLYAMLEMLSNPTDFTVSESLDERSPIGKKMGAFFRAVFEGTLADDGVRTLAQQFEAAVPVSARQTDPEPVEIETGTPEIPAQAPVPQAPSGTAVTDPKAAAAIEELHAFLMRENPNNGKPRMLTFFPGANLWVNVLNTAKLQSNSSRDGSDFRGEYLRQVGAMADVLRRELFVRAGMLERSPIQKENDTRDSVFLSRLDELLGNAIDTVGKGAFASEMINWGMYIPVEFLRRGLLAGTKYNAYSRVKIRFTHGIPYAALAKHHMWEGTRALRKSVNSLRLSIHESITDAARRYANVPEVKAITDAYAAEYASQNHAPDRSKWNFWANLKTEFVLETSHGFRQQLRDSGQRLANALAAVPGADLMKTDLSNKLRSEDLTDELLDNTFQSVWAANPQFIATKNHLSDADMQATGDVFPALGQSTPMYEGVTALAGVDLPPMLNYAYDVGQNGYAKDSVQYQPRMIFRSFKDLFTGLVNPAIALRGKQAMYDAMTMPGLASVLSRYRRELDTMRGSWGLNNRDGSLNRMYKVKGYTDTSIDPETGYINPGANKIEVERMERRVALLALVDSATGLKTATSGYMSQDDLAMVHLVDHLAWVLSNDYENLTAADLVWRPAADLLPALRGAKSGDRFEVDAAGVPGVITVQRVDADSRVHYSLVVGNGQPSIGTQLAPDATSFGAGVATWRKNLLKGNHISGAITDIKVDLTQRRDEDGSAWPVMLERIADLRLPAELHQRLLAELNSAAQAAEGAGAKRNEVFLGLLEAQGLAIIPEDGVAETKLMIPYTWVEAAFDASPTKAKLINAGRDKDRLTMWSSAEQYQRMFKGMREAAQKAFGLSLGADSEFLFARGSSGVMFSGHGFFPYVARVAQDKIFENLSKVSAERTAKFADVISEAEAGNNSLASVTAPMLRYLFDLYGEPMSGVSAQKIKEDITNGVYAAGTRRGLKIPANATKSDIARLVHDKCMTVLTARIVATSPIEPEGIAKTDVEALLSVIHSVYGDDRMRGDPDMSAFENQATNFHDLYTKFGILPANLSGMDAVERYSHDLARYATTRYTLINMLLAEDVDGTPLYYANPNLNFDGDGVIPDNVWEMAARKWARFWNQPYDASLTAKQNAAAIVGGFVASSLASTARGYRSTIYGRTAAYMTPVPSPSSMKSITGFYALKDREDGDSPALARMFSGGEAAGMLKHVLRLHTLGETNGFMRNLLRFNNILRMQAMAASFFFPVATMEGIWSVGGPRAMLSTRKTKSSKLAQSVAGLTSEAVRRLPGFSFDVNAEDTKEMLKSQFTIGEWWEMIESNHPYVAQLQGMMEEAGMTWSHGDNNPYTLRLTEIKAGLNAAEDAVAKVIGKKAARGVRQVVDSITSEQSEFVFDHLTNAAKMMATHTILQGVSAKAQREKRRINPVYVLRQHASYLDAEISGPNANRYAWATPQVQEILNVLMFSWRWTLGAWESAGLHDLTKFFFGHSMTKQERSFIWKRRWPMMAALVMVIEPTIIQAAGAIMYKLFSEDDDEEKRRVKTWVWQNESGKKLSANISPLLKMLDSYKGGTTSKRQTYVRAGKQAWEIMGWFEDPVRTLGGKMSLPFHMAYEWATGVTAGMDQDLGFKNKGFIERFWTGENGFKDSFTAYAFEKYSLPFSVSGYLRNKEALLFSAVLPTSRGVNLYSATAATKELLRGWADDDNYAVLYGDGRMRAHLYTLTRDVLNAAAENGYNPKTILSTARRALLHDKYAEFMNALPEPGARMHGSQAVALERAARGILRLNGTASSLRDSMETKNRFQNKPSRLNDVQKAAMLVAFSDPKKIPAQYGNKQDMIKAKLTVAAAEYERDIESRTRKPTSYGVVKRVIDGDTVEMEDGSRVRMNGIDTPETGKPQYGTPGEPMSEEAKRRATELLVGKKVRVIHPKSGRVQTHADREIGYIEVPKGILAPLANVPGVRGLVPGTDVQEQLISEGYAQPMTVGRTHARRQRYEEAAEAPRAEGAGVFNPDVNKKLRYQYRQE